jgi:serine/threonine-protein kinase
MGQPVTVRLLPPTARQPARAGAIHAALQTAFPHFRDPYAVSPLNFQVLHEAHPFVVMEPISGPTLAERLVEPSGLADTERVAIVREVGGCLSAAHRAGVTHGALSVDSVVLVHGRAKVMDWGLWPLVVERLDADPSPADDVAALAGIAQEMGCALDVEGGFPVELLGLLPRGPRRTHPRPPAPPPPRPSRVLRGPVEVENDVVDLTSQEEALDVGPAPDDEEFGWPPASSEPRAAIRGRETTATAPPRPPAAPQPIAVRRAPAATPVEAPVEAPQAPAPSAAREEESEEPEGVSHEDKPRTRLRNIGVAIARIVGIVLLGLLVLALLWRIGAGTDRSPTPTTPAPASASSPQPTIEGTTVPNVLGMHVDLAEERLEAAGLNVERVVRLGDGTTVERTDPTPGEAVLVGTEVVVYVGADVPSD